MRKWIPMLLAVLFVIVCLLLAAPAPASAVTPYIRFVTAAGWIAVFLIVVFLAYVVYTAKKR